MRCPIKSHMAARMPFGFLLGSTGPSRRPRPRSEPSAFHAGSRDPSSMESRSRTNRELNVRPVGVGQGGQPCWSYCTVGTASALLRSPPHAQYCPPCSLFPLLPWWACYQQMQQAYIYLQPSAVKDRLSSALPSIRITTSELAGRQYWVSQPQACLPGREGQGTACTIAVIDSHVMRAAVAGPRVCTAAFRYYSSGQCAILLISYRVSPDLGCENANCTRCSVVRLYVARPSPRVSCLST